MGSRWAEEAGVRISTLWAILLRELEQRWKEEDRGAWWAAVHGVAERLHFHFSLSCIGEGHGNPLQCSCLENHMDGGAWWAAISGVTQSRTRLK